MLKKFPILALIKYLFAVAPLYILAELVNSNHEYIVYSFQQMQEHKKKCIAQMHSDQQNIKDSTYQMQRAIKTVLADDTDYIPKVIGAGEIFYDGVAPYQLMHNGLRIHLNSYYDVQWLTDVIHALKGHHEPQEEKCFHEVLKYIPENAVIIELGSYWAYYSLWFMSQIKNAKAYLIEPDTQRLEIGKKNFELNNKTGFFQRGFVGIISDSEPDMTGAECISVDDFIERQGIEHVNILHADIQGAEYAMLKSMIKHFDKIDYFFISTHEPIVSQKELINFFETNECIILAEHNGPESASGDGLIVAKRKNVLEPKKISIRKY